MICKGEVFVIRIKFIKSMGGGGNLNKNNFVELCAFSYLLTTLLQLIYVAFAPHLKAGASLGLILNDG